MEIIREAEVAKMTGVPRGTLQYWRGAGKGPRWAKFEGTVVYRRADVEAWIEAQFAKAAGGAA